MHIYLKEDASNLVGIALLTCIVAFGLSVCAEALIGEGTAVLGVCGGVLLGAREVRAASRRWQEIEALDRSTQRAEPAYRRNAAGRLVDEKGRFVRTLSKAERNKGPAQAKRSDYFKDTAGRWHRPNGHYATEEEVALALRKIFTHPQA